MGWLGANGKNEMLDKQIKGWKGMKADNLSWYDKDYNADATQLADNQRMWTRTVDYLRNANKQARQTQEVNGGTEESLAATKAAGAQVLDDLASQIAANGVARKDRIQEDFRNRDMALNEKIINTEAQKANGWDMANAVLNGGSKGLGVGLDMPEQKGWKNWI